MTVFVLLAREGICVTQILEKAEHYRISKDVEKLCINTLMPNLALDLYCD